ncbi:MAG TPA: LytTR family DNA-binding domain-containing protein [Chitinophagaceae bacterium]|nr:response regulator transcription factor [Bacteroidia bacterium]HUM97305.1 LytTR family DNA-binding domain-containing protein [Chitinophagaceae bacterium]
MSQLFKAIVIDDEPAARRLMLSLLSEYKDVIEVIGEASNGREAVQKIETLQPDIIFLDIQMPDMTGFEVIEKLGKKPNIVFTTAYEQYAMKAFETFSIDYLLKPIREERLAISIEKLKQFGKLNSIIDLKGLQDVIEQLRAPKKSTALPIKTGDRINLIRFENICFLEANDKYVYIHTMDGQRILTDHTLSYLEEKLPEQFYRVQKSFIINKELIKEMHKHFNGRFLFVMNDKNATQITSGRTYNESIKEEFGFKF